MYISLDQLTLFIQQTFAALIELITIDTGGTCGSHLLAALAAAVVMKPAATGARRTYSAAKVGAAKLRKRK